MSRKIIPVFIFSFVVFAFACSSESRDSSNDGHLIKNTYDEWVESTNAKDINRWSSFLAPGAVFLPPGSHPLETKDEIKAYYISLFQDPNFNLDCNQIFVQVAESGDLAWSRGVCKATFSTPGGDVGHGSSKWTKVWVRRPDGTWKCRLNTWNYNESN